MESNRYRIVFDGTLLPGMTLDSVKENLARLFKTDREKVDQLFTRGPLNIKRELTASEADRYLQALRQAGAEARKEAEPGSAPTLSLVDIAPAGSAKDPTATRMECPKCGHSQPNAIQCDSCGIVIEKYLARQARLAEDKVADDAQNATHPYATPRAQVAEPMPAYGELRAFSLQGRIGRLRYLAWSMTLSVAALALLAVAGIGFAISQVLGVVLFAMIGIGFVVVSVQIGVQRLHDIGWSGWFLLLNLVPAVGSFFPLVMLLYPGQADANRFGPPQPPNSRAVKILAALWLLVPVIGILAAIALPAYQQYLYRAGM
ncbi:MAG: DUF805 domain-containing protein [Pseudomonas sp.]